MKNPSAPASAAGARSRPVLTTFRRDPRRLACADAVFHAWREQHGADSIPPAALYALAAARSASGRCGALLAACALAPERTATLEAGFAAITGDARCLDLRRPDTHPCQARVDAALALLSSVSAGHNDRE